MKRLGQILVKAGCWLADCIFEFIMSLGEEDEQYEDNWQDSSSAPLCHLCGQKAPGHQLKGELVVCDKCREGN